MVYKISLDYKIMTENLVPICKFVRKIKRSGEDDRESELHIRIICDPMSPDQKLDREKLERAVEEKLASQLCKGNREIARKFKLDKIEYLPESRYRDICLELQDKNGTPWDDLTNDQKKMFIEFVEGSATKWRRRSGVHMTL